MATFRGAVLLVTALALVTRIAWLDADPSLFKRPAELPDEGFWAHNARAAVVLGREFPDDLAQAPTAAPLFHWLLTGVFGAFGVGFASLRAVSAAAGILLVPLAMLLVAPTAGVRAAVLIGVVVLANHELFAFARLGMPEMLHLLLAVAGALAWLRRRGWGGSALAGALFALALLAKFNVLVVAGFAGVWALEALQGRRLLGDLAAGAAGGALVLVPWALGYYVPHATLFGLNNLALNRDRLLLQPSDLGRLPLHFISNGFWGLPSTFLLLALAARHLARLPARFATGWRDGVRALSPLETLALGWLIGVGLPTALLVRAVDERRNLVLLIPLAVLAVLGVAAREPLPAGGRASRGAIGALVTASVLTGLALVFGAGYGYLLWSVGAVVTLVAAVALGLLLARLAAGGVLTTKGTIVATAVAGMVLPALSLGQFAAWADIAPAGATAMAGLAIVAAITAASGRVAATALAAYIVWGVWSIGVNVAGPTYTAREVAAAVDALATPGEAIVGAFAHVVALETSLHPVWYTPRRAYNRLLNQDLGRFPVGWVLTMDGSETVRAGDFAFPLARPRTLRLFPAPRGGSKVTLHLYRRAP